MKRTANNQVLCWLVGLVAISVYTLSAQPAAPQNVRDHRSKPSEPVVRDHRTQPEVRDHRKKVDPALVAALAKAVEAARNGPEVKKLNVAGHEFNVKKATVTGTAKGGTITGQISHHLTARPDDQVYYTIKKAGGKVTSVEIKIARGGLTKYVTYPSRYYQKYVDQTFPADQIESFLRDLGRMIDGSWESSADLIVAHIAMKINPPTWTPDGRAGQPPPPIGPANQPTVRDHRTGGPQVRDHRR